MPKHKIGKWSLTTETRPNNHEGRLKEMIRLQEHRRKIANTSRRRNRK